MSKRLTLTALLLCWSCAIGGEVILSWGYPAGPSVSNLYFRVYERTPSSALGWRHLCDVPGSERSVRLQVERGSWRWWTMTAVSNGIESEFSSK